MSHARRLSIVVEKAGKRTLIAKGAPEGILACSTSMRTSDGKTVPLTHAPCRAVYESLPETTRKLLRCEVVERLPEERAETYVEFKY